MKLQDVFALEDGRIRVGWRVAFFVVATVTATVISSGIFFAIFSFAAVANMARETSLSLSEVVQVIGLLIATDVSRRVVDGAKARDRIWDGIGLGRSALRARPLLIALAAGTFALLLPSTLLLVAKRFSFESQPGAQLWLSETGRAIFLFAPAAFAEELMVRGYLLNTLLEGFGKPAAIALTSLTFGALHLMNPGTTVLSTGMVVLAGVFLAAVRLSTGSLWAATVAHLAWNLVQAVVLHAPVSGVAIATPGYRLVDHGPIWLTGGAWGPEGGLAAALGMLVATFLLLRHSKETPEIAKNE